MTSATTEAKDWTDWVTPGLFWLLIATAGAVSYFSDGLDALFAAWALPEYSHGPVIPLISALLLLRQLKQYPPSPGPKRDRWIGVTFVLASIALATLGKLAGIADIVAYATILWIGGILLVSFGWSTGRHLWPPVLHLVYMLPLPGVLYYKMSTWLQLVSSELGVWLLHLMAVPVFLDGNIIDLGVTQLHVAEACSGLRYLFPILSFSYVFAVLYRGPFWHKAVLLISAAPITLVLNSVRIAVVGYFVNIWGVDWVDDFTQLFEGGVIFIASILILIVLARAMLLLHPRKTTLLEALDLDSEAVLSQLTRLRFVHPSGAMILSALIMSGAAIAWQMVPGRETAPIGREGFTAFPRQLGEWRRDGVPQSLSPRIESRLGADDYHMAVFERPGAAATVEFFSAWYADQSKGGVHSPEICMPGGGWEIEWLERTDVAEALGYQTAFNINRAIIRKGESRMMVYYWFEQKGRRIAWDFAAKYYLLLDGIRTGRTDGALVRLTTPILPGEDPVDSEARLKEILYVVDDALPRFIPAN